MFILLLAGRTRHNTLKRYVKVWRAFRQWLTAARGDGGSPEVGDLIEYLFARYDEPCGPTVPPLIVKAVVWFERTACIDPRERIGESQVVCSVRDYIVDMLSRDRPPTQRAPRYPVVMMEAFEHMVEDESLRVGFRLIAWIKLVKLLGNFEMGRHTEDSPEGAQVLWRTHDNNPAFNQDNRAFETCSGAASMCLRACIHF